MSDVGCLIHMAIFVSFVIRCELCDHNYPGGKGHEVHEEITTNTKDLKNKFEFICGNNH